jgi:hypothetical protein
MQSFDDIFGKDAGVNGVHARTAIGNEGRKRRAARREMAATTAAESVKDPDVGLDEENDSGDIVHASKGWSLPLEIKKFDQDQQLMFGWASVVEKDGRIIVDKQGDIIPAEELEKAAYEYTLSSRVQGDMHDTVGVGRMVESMVFTKEKQKALGIDLGLVGWWVGFKVDDTELWAAVKRGEKPEFSIGGSSRVTTLED